MEYPVIRKRRLRRTESLRRMVQETRLDPSQFMAPLFIVPGKGVRKPIASLSGQFHLSADAAAAECRELDALGIHAVLLFGIPVLKDERGSHASLKEGVVQQAIGAIKAAVPRMTVVTDVCLCEYTSHGHCGLLKGRSVDNDATLPLLCDMALSHAEVGADIVAPSDMMDGRVAAIRSALDAKGFTETAILSYAAKYASGYYGPFREAAGSAPQSGDRKGYQMDPANAREALHEIVLDEAEGADIVMVKPALAYLDVIRAVRERTLLPLAAYNVSGEYAMILAAAEKGLIDLDRVMLETLLSIKRAGADILITYFARRAAELLREENA